MALKMTIRAVKDRKAQIGFEKDFNQKAGIDLFDHVLVKYQGDTEVIYTMMDDHQENILIELLAKYNVDIMSMEKCDENILKLYYGNKVEEFINSFDLEDFTTYFEVFYQTFVNTDTVLDKISYSGINSLNHVDKNILEMAAA